MSNRILCHICDMKVSAQMKGLSEETRSLYGCGRSQSAIKVVDIRNCEMRGESEP